MAKRIFNLYADYQDDSGRWHCVKIVDNGDRAELRGILRDADFKAWAKSAGYSYLSVVISQYIEAGYSVGPSFVDQFDLRGYSAIAG